MFSRKADATMSMCVCTQVAAQPEEAVELYLAADRPRQALAILNTQMSSVMPQAAEETATGIISTGRLAAP